MTIQEVGSGLHIEAQNLKFYLDNGLLSGIETESAGVDFKEDDLERTLQFHMLLKSGVDIELVKRLARLTGSKLSAYAEQIKLLRKCRYQILEEIHSKQQCLDQLDFMIREAKQKQTKEEVSST